MSVHRENITWQSPDGTWNRGFYDFHVWGEDNEWDVEYDFDRFWWVSTGHATEDAAYASWHGANPGGGSIFGPEDEEADYRLRLEDIAAQAFVDTRAQTYGPKKERVPKMLARQLATARVEAHRHRVQGYANLPDPRIPEWEAALDARMRTASPHERAEVREELQRAATTLEGVPRRHPQHAAQRHQARRPGSGVGCHRLLAAVPGPERGPPRAGAAGLGASEDELEVHLRVLRAPGPQRP